jgi:DNA polymerase
MQNPPKVDKSRMRYAMKAPAGHVMIAADLAQIEARIVAWIAGQRKLLHAFRNGDDIYSEFATIAYRKDTKKGRSKEDDKRRFVGKTCILGLGYGMGSEKLKNTLFKDNVKVDLTEAQRLVNTYRSVYRDIPLVWGTGGAALSAIAVGKATYSYPPCELRKNCVILPSGRAIMYHNMHWSNHEWFYNFGHEVRSLWGGKLLENVTQALARDMVMSNMLVIKDQLGLTPVLQVHDELDYIVPEEQAESYGREIAGIMSTPPSWAPDLPVAVEIAYGESFGDCK